MKKVVHHISLKNIGGMQDAFLSYYNKLSLKEKNNLEIYGNFPIEKNFYSVKNYYYLGFNLFFWIKFLTRLRDKQTTVILHGLLASKKFNLLLKIFRSSNLIFYEHGIIWNVEREFSKIVQSNSEFCNKIIANSLATKIMLQKKFKINSKKIKVLYYGFKKNKKIKLNNKIKNFFTVGFIGRFDSHKGIHVLLKAFNNIKDKKIILKIAGNGDLYNYFTKKYEKNDNIKFDGRVSDVFNFLSSIDILIVPSIREPLGIVILQAALAKVPVIASWVDGIPEIIKKNFGILIKPTKKIDSKIFKYSKISKPEFVIDFNKNLNVPKEIDYKKLSEKIIFLKNNRKLAKKYSINLYKFVKKNFSQKKYYKNFNNIIYEKK
tara:strand:- start:601 stop:1728 length:1128 start_codon:yes stop_codon:yes gene_type:complete